MLKLLNDWTFITIGAKKAGRNNEMVVRRASDCICCQPGSYFFFVLPFSRFSSFDEENAKFCCENIAAHLEHTLEWEKEMVIKRQQEVRSL